MVEYEHCWLGFSLKENTWNIIGCWEFFFHFSTMIKTPF